MYDRKSKSRTPAIGMPFDLNADKGAELAADTLSLSLQIVNIDRRLKNAVRENQLHNDKAIASYAKALRGAIDLHPAATSIAEERVGQATYRSEARTAYESPILT